MASRIVWAIAAGVPPIVLCRTSTDAAHAATLAERGALISLGCHWTPDDVASAVAALVEDPARRTAIGRAGRELVDGRGAERVAAKL